MCSVHLRLSVGNGLDRSAVYKHLQKGTYFQALYLAETICFTSLPLEGKVAAEPSDEV